jgi:hypothetical protein
MTPEAEASRGPGPGIWKGEVPNMKDSDTDGDTMYSDILDKPKNLSTPLQAGSDLELHDLKNTLYLSIALIEIIERKDINNPPTDRVLTNSSEVVYQKLHTMAENQANEN